MKKTLRIIVPVFMVFILILPVSIWTKDGHTEETDDFCTCIIVGKNASVDGSVIISHTDAAPECRIHVVPAQTFPKGATAPVYYGIQDVKKPINNYGEVIGSIPQVEKTYAYIHSGYPHINEY
jgi:dipeptidase